MSKDADAVMEAAQRQQQLIREGAPVTNRWASMPITEMVQYGFTEKDEGTKHLNFIEHIKDPWRRYVVAQVLETMKKKLDGLSEAVRMHMIGGYEKFIFPTIAAVYGNLVLEELVSMQPLTAPSGTIFYLDVLAGSTKGRIRKGDKLYSAISGPQNTPHFAGETVEEEEVSSVDVGEQVAAGNLSYIPVRPGTVVFTDGTQEVTDDGDGNLVGDCAAGGTINYATGAYSFTFSYATDAETTVTYQYDSELSTQVPEVDIRLVASTVHARTNKLKTYWSVESQQDLMQLHGLDVEPTILGYSVNEIMREICYRVLNHLRTVASAGALTWNRVPPAGVQWIFHKQELRDVIVRGSGLIRQATRRWRANWLVGNVEFCSVVKVLDGFTPVVDPVGVGGIYKIGMLDNVAIYEDPDAPDAPQAGGGTALLGRKGATFIEAPYVFAPYLGVYTTDTITMPDFKSRKGLMYRAGTKLIDAGQYATITMTNITTP